MSATQPTILGPLLFWIYVNDIQYACTNAGLNLFTDDSNLFVVGRNLIELYDAANLACSQVSYWFQCNRLTVNFAKSAYILFFPNVNDDDFTKSNDLCIRLDNTLINRVFVTKFGILLDDKLSFKNHINSITCKINGLNGILYRLRDYIPLSCRRSLYFALVHPRIQYGIEIYSKATLKLLQPLHISCNRVLRTLQDQRRFCHVNLLYHNFRILSYMNFIDFLFAKWYINVLIIMVLCQLLLETFSSPYNLIISIIRDSNTSYLWSSANSVYFKSMFMIASQFWTTFLYTFVILSL